MFFYHPEALAMIAGDSGIRHTAGQIEHFIELTVSLNRIA